MYKQRKTMYLHGIMSRTLLHTELLRLNTKKDQYAIQIQM